MNVINGYNVLSISKCVHKKMLGEDKKKTAKRIEICKSVYE